MFGWLMPLIISIGISTCCPGPESLRCGGVPCHPSSSPHCCENRCGSYTSLPASPLTHPQLINAGRLKRATLQSTECDGSSNETKVHGCSVCVCRSHVWMCETKNCQACQLKSSDTMYDHGEEFVTGCSSCRCNDGHFECDHSQCRSCYYKTTLQLRDNQTVSGDSTKFKCGECQCYNGHWTCEETCQSTAHRGQPSLLVLLVIPWLLLMF